MASESQPAELADLPPNWTVEGPVVTDQGSRACFITGTLTAPHHDVEQTLVAFRPADEAQWVANSHNAGRRTSERLHAGTRAEALRAIVTEADRINRDWAAIDRRGFEVPA